MKIAVIGSGISGLSAAYYLALRHEVSLFEQDSRAGGHTHTFMHGAQPVDTGWIVYNGVNYPNLTALFGELGVETRPASMSFGVSLGDGAYEYKGSDQIWTVFAQASNLFSPRHIKMLVDLLRFNGRCKQLLANGSLPAGSLGDLLREQNLSPWLASRYLLPMAGLIWSCSPKKAMEYPAADFLRFFDAHSLFNAVDQPTWRTVIGGSHQYVKKMLAHFKGRLKLNTPVQRITRSGGAVQVDGEDFDQVICATHSDQALRLLADASDDEKQMLGGIPYNQSRCVLHTDESFLPKRRAAWACWNYLNPVDEIHDRPISGSYWMNALQGLPGPLNYIVTLNPVREVPREKVLLDINYEHPHYGAGSVMTHRRIREIQGRRGVWWAGAWNGYGFHEDGLKSGLSVVKGLDAACLPGWVKL